MDNSEQTVIIGRISAESDRASGPWASHLAHDDVEAGPSGDAAAGLASLSFLTAAIRRRKRLWCLTAVIGMILGGSLYLLRPPPYQATAEILLTMGPTEDLQSATSTDATLAESPAVAAIALQQLGLKQNTDSLVSSITAVPVTNRILDIAVKAPSASSALRETNAVAQAFLQYRAAQLNSYAKLASISLSQQLSKSKARIAVLSSELEARTGSTVTGQTVPSTDPRIIALQTQLGRARDTLTGLQQSARETEQTTQTATDTAVHDSKVVGSATLLHHSRIKTGVIYVLTGLIAGLALGLGFVVIHALVSDRIRQRGDIAYALGVPVRLSMSWARRRPLALPRRPRLSDISHPDLQRIIGHLRDDLGYGAKGTALAVLPADQPEVAALVLVGLALSCAKQDKQVVLADLFPGSPAGRLLGTARPGVHKVEVEGAVLTLTVPERRDVVPTGPLASVAAAPKPGETPSIGAEPAGTDLPPADVMLTLAALDPMLGAEHVATWAREAVVTVTAGRSSWTRVQAVGEMTRLAGFRRVSAVLVGADKSDESLGRTAPPRAHPPTAASNGSYPADSAIGAEY